jgi:predicted ATPase/DNA-binding CsgD family transcriptional regulator
VRSNLPLARTSLIGRDQQVARLERLLDEAAVVTVTGTGGVGKTRLALAVAHRLVDRFPDGVWFADLAPAKDDAVPAEVARLVGVTPGSADPVPLIVEQLADRRVLLVLDNCEHLVGPAAALVHRLVTACPGLRVLATSREPLAIGAEVTLPVPPLGVADAVRLFVDRASAADPAFAADDAAIAILCDRLDGIPLAIELAAPWIRMFSPAELVPRLADRFDLLATTRRDLPARQQTMRATVEWSHHLLAEDQRVLFRRLAVFNGGFTLDAAERVAGLPPLDPGRVAALLAGLHERSMVVGTSRYRLLETLRDFATERLVAAGEAPTLSQRHFEYYRNQAERVDVNRLRTGSDAGVATLVPDGDNHRAALVWSIDNDPPGALRLAGALEGFWMVRSVAEGRQWVQRALDLVSEPSLARARALMVSPLVVAGGIPWPQARRLIEASISGYTNLGDQNGVALARLMLALAAFFNGDLAEARRNAEHARHVDHPLVRARAGTYLGVTLSFTPRRLAEGRRLMREGADASHGIGDAWGEGMALTVLGLADIRAGYRDLAARHLRQALRTTLQAGVTATAVGGLGELATDARHGLTLLEAAVAVRERTGVPAFPIHIGRQLGRARDTARGRLAAPVAERCRTRARAMTTDEVVGYALADMPPTARRLTARQQEIALLVADGLSNREVAQRLHLSVRTVETHVNNVLTELGLHSRTRLAGWVRDAGLPT